MKCKWCGAYIVEEGHGYWFCSEACRKEFGKLFGRSES